MKKVKSAVTKDTHFRHRHATAFSLMQPTPPKEKTYEEPK